MTHAFLARLSALTASVVAGGLIIAGASALTSAQAKPAENTWNSASSETSQPRKGPKCLDIRDAGGFHVVDERTLMVQDRMGNAYLLDVGGPCRSMTDMSNFGFEVRGTDQLCRAHDAMLLYSHSGETPVRCVINGVKPIDRAEADRLWEER